MQMYHTETAKKIIIIYTKLESFKLKIRLQAIQHSIKKHDNFSQWGYH